MEWQKVKRINIATDEPCISIKPNRFYFNVVFVRVAQIESYSFMNIFCNDDERCIGFQFKKEKDSPDDYKINGSIKKGLYGQCREIVEKGWVRSVIQNNKNNQFYVSRDGKIWFIKLMPAFETSVLRSEYQKINAELCGIYRYVNKEHEIVYIGKGNIRKRLSENQREGWDFVKIEYSQIEDDEKAYEWELFWIDKYESEKGRIPIYNQIRGHRNEK